MGQGPRKNFSPGWRKWGLEGPTKAGPNTACPKTVTQSSQAGGADA